MDQPASTPEAGPESGSGQPTKAAGLPRAVELWAKPYVSQPSVSLLERRAGDADPVTGGTRANESSDRDRRDRLGCPAHP